MQTAELTKFVVSVQPATKEILQALGNPEFVATSALRRYLVDVCWQRIEQAEQRIAEYERKFGSTYEAFNRRITTDESFLEATHQAYPTWEADAIEWEYRVEELQTWRTRLEKILHESSPLPAQD